MSPPCDLTDLTTCSTWLRAPCSSSNDCLGSNSVCNINNGECSCRSLDYYSLSADACISGKACQNSYFFLFSWGIPPLQILLFHCYQNLFSRFMFCLATSLQARYADLPASPAGLLGRFAPSGFALRASRSHLARSARARFALCAHEN